MTSRRLGHLMKRGHVLASDRQERGNGLRSWAVVHGQLLGKVVDCSPQPRLLFRHASTTSESSIDTGTYTVVPQRQPDWQKAVSDAETLFESFASHSTLQSLLSDDAFNIAGQLKKYAGSSHPLLRRAKELLLSEHSSTQLWGLIVMLMSKVAGHENPEELELCDQLVGVSRRQRKLAENTQLLHMVPLLHKGVVNLSGDLIEEAALEDMMSGNKIAILAGDLLLANFLVNIASLRNPRVVELMCMSLSDITQGDFVGSLDLQGNPLPFPGISLEYWKQRHFLSAGSLLANACQAAVILSGHNEETQKKAYEFGKELSFAWQAHTELRPFTDLYLYPPGTPFDLISCPVILHMMNNPELCEDIQKTGNSANDCDYEKIHEKIMTGNGVWQTKELCRRHSEAALEILYSSFNPSDARTALANIVNALCLN